MQFVPSWMLNLRKLLTFCTTADCVRVAVSGTLPELVITTVLDPVSPGFTPVTLMPAAAYLLLVMVSVPVVTELPGLVVEAVHAAMLPNTTAAVAMPNARIEMRNGSKSAAASGAHDTDLEAVLRRATAHLARVVERGEQRNLGRELAQSMRPDFVPATRDWFEAIRNQASRDVEIATSALTDVHVVTDDNVQAMLEAICGVKGISAELRAAVGSTGDAVAIANTTTPSVVELGIERWRAGT